MSDILIYDMNYSKEINRFVDDYKKTLKGNLVGIYLHGSFAMNCNTSSSDIDLIVVVKNSLCTADKKSLIKIILDIKNLPAKGIEMSVVLEENCTNFVYPTPFELHYSDYHRSKYLSDTEYICGNSTDKDLAAHFMITKHRGIRLVGKSIGEVFGAIPEYAYIDSIVNDIKNAEIKITGNPTYIILNLCRVLNYLDEKSICSKPEGGQWALTKIDTKHKLAVVKALENYKEGNEFSSSNSNELNEFAKYMLDKIGIALKLRGISQLLTNR